MESMLNTAADFLIRQSWQVSIVFAFVLALSWGVRNVSSHWRYLLWLVVIAKCLTPPLAQVPLAILPTSSAVVPPRPMAVDGQAIPHAGELRSSTHTAHQLITSFKNHEQSVIAAPPVQIPSSTSPPRFDLRQWLVIAWMAVIGILFASVSGKVWLTERRLRRSRRPADAETTSMIGAIATNLGMSNLPLVYVAPTAPVPFVWGYLRGNIYLPKQFSAIGSIEQRRAILTHELAHVMRGDAAANLIQIIVQTIFFFHPLIWWTNARIRFEREKCCDEIVLSGLEIPPQVYCEAIVNMLALGHLANHPTPALAVTGAAKTIADRMSSILAPHQKFYRRPSRIGIITLALIAASVLPTIFVLTTRAETPPSPVQADKPIPNAVDVKKLEAATKIVKTPAKAAWQPGQVMDVRVVHSQTKEPIPDVTLELQFTGAGIDFMDVKTQTTDPEGRSLIKLPDLPPTEVRVYPTKAGFVPIRVYWGEEQPYVTVPKSVTIELEPGKPFGGTILNQEGKPVPNAIVTVDYWGAEPEKNPHLRPHVDAKATSDKAGRWQVDVMPAATEEKNLRIYVSHPDYVSDHLQPGVGSNPVIETPPVSKLFNQSAVMVMRKGESIHGQVVDEQGLPIANARVYDDEIFFNGYEVPRTTTGPDGKFRIAGVDSIRPEKYFIRQFGTRMNLTIHASGYAPELIEPERLSPVKIELKRSKSVHGRVIDDNGRAIEGAAIAASLWRGQKQRPNLHAKTNAAGEFTLNDVPTDQVEYGIWKDGYTAKENFVMSPSPDPYLITLKGPLHVVGTVTDAETGQPVERFSLMSGVDLEDGRAPWWMRVGLKTVTNGTYDFSLNQEGFVYLLRVEAKGYLPAISRGFRPHNPDKGEVTFDFKLHKANPITGTVLGLDGNPLADAEVYLATQAINILNRKVNDRESLTTKTDAAGRFEFPPEVEPFCLVVAHQQGVAMVTEDEFETPPQISIRRWTRKNETLQIIRKPAQGQSVDFPTKYP